LASEANTLSTELRAPISANRLIVSASVHNALGIIKIRQICLLDNPINHYERRARKFN
jgi:hypothetical protein